MSSLETGSAPMKSSACLWRLRSRAPDSQTKSLMKVVLRIDSENVFNYSSSSLVNIKFLYKNILNIKTISKFIINFFSLFMLPIIQLTVYDGLVGNFKTSSSSEITYFELDNIKALSESQETFTFVFEKNQISLLLNSQK